MKSANEYFYMWQNGSVTNGSILYATTSPLGIILSNLNYTNGTHLAEADSAYGFSQGVSDGIDDTFIGVENFQSPSMGSPIVANSTALDSWKNYMLRLGAGGITTSDDIVWATEILNDMTSFDGSLADYEMLLPENEEPGDGQGIATSYYLWIEIQ